MNDRLAQVHQLVQEDVVADPAGICTSLKLRAMTPRPAQDPHRERWLRTVTLATVSRARRQGPKPRHQFTPGDPPQRELRRRTPVVDVRADPDALVAHHQHPASPDVLETDNGGSPWSGIAWRPALDRRVPLDDSQRSLTTQS